MNRNSDFPTFGVIALCVLTIFMSAPYLIQMLNTMRQHAEHMNCNSGFPTFGVIALCMLTIFMSTP